jgi:hypothetical protein
MEQTKVLTLLMQYRVTVGGAPIPPGIDLSSRLYLNLLRSCEEEARLEMIGIVVRSRVALARNLSEACKALNSAGLGPESAAILHVSKVFAETGSLDTVSDTEALEALAWLDGHKLAPYYPDDDSCLARDLVDASHILKYLSRVPAQAGPGQTQEES